MKDIVRTTIACLGLFVIAFYSSCTNDLCEQVLCAHNSICIEGSCHCQTGYEGVHCETIERDKFLGSYLVSESGTKTGLVHYNTTIEAGTTLNEIILKNFNNQITDDIIAVVESKKITINPQRTTNNFLVEGWAEIIPASGSSLHYWQDASIDFYYSVTNTALNPPVINEFGTGGSQPSSWSKQ